MQRGAHAARSWRRARLRLTATSCPLTGVPSAAFASALCTRSHTGSPESTKKQVPLRSPLLCRRWVQTALMCMKFGKQLVTHSHRGKLEANIYELPYVVSHTDLQKPSA